MKITPPNSITQNQSPLELREIYKLFYIQKAEGESPSSLLPAMWRQGWCLQLESLLVPQKQDKHTSLFLWIDREKKNLD